MRTKAHEVLNYMADPTVVKKNADIIEGDLLPPNSSKLEQRLSKNAVKISKLPIDTHTLWDASQCSESFLPWLAWALSVGHWEKDWDENVKRSLIKQSVNLHKHRGTLAAVKDAVRLVLALAHDNFRKNISSLAEYDKDFLIREWWQPNNETKSKEAGVTKSSQPLSFEIILLIGRGVLGGRGLLRPELYRDLRRAIDAVKPMSTRYTLSIGGAKLESELPLSSHVRVIRMVSFTLKPES